MDAIFTIPYGEFAAADKLIKAVTKYWDINEWKQLMLSLYQTGYYAEWYDDQPIERPLLKNVEKAKYFAKKYNLELACDNEGF